MMNVSRFMFFMGALSALAIAGCGGSGYDSPSPEASPAYAYRKVMLSPDKQFEVITYAYKEGYTPTKIVYREYGYEGTAVTQELQNQGRSYQGDKEYFFWAPSGHKLYGMTITYKVNQPHTTALVVIEPNLVTTNGRTYLDTKEVRYSTDVLEKFDAASADIEIFHKNEYTWMYPTGFSADGSSLLYSKFVQTSQGNVVTKYAYNYQTGVNTEVTP